MSRLSLQTCLSNLTLFNCNVRNLAFGLQYVNTLQGRLQGGSGRNLRPVWLWLRGKNSTLKGEEFPRYMGLKIDYCK